MDSTAREYLTEQEKFWAGDFGDEYIKRNQSRELVAGKTGLLSRAVSRCQGLRSVIEFGSNIGLNMLAMRYLLPDVELSAIEINPKAFQQVQSLGFVNAYNCSILDFEADTQRDLAFTMGVLIHINPEHLPTVYDRLYAASRRYVLICEYYNPTPMEVEYRGHSGKLFKRDFAGDFLDRHKGTELVDYGFAYHRDPMFVNGDFTWFLMQKPPQAVPGAAG